MKLQICDLCKQFDGVAVLDHVSMELESGHIYCLTAPSGKGKTTLFRILMGLETADSALLEAAMNEPLHEPYRIPLIPEYEEVRQLCVNQGAAAVMISGSGPTLLALFLDTLP